jgi:hypothetical protein
VRNSLDPNYVVGSVTEQGLALPFDPEAAEAIRLPLAPFNPWSPAILASDSHNTLPHTEMQIPNLFDQVPISSRTVHPPISYETSGHAHVQISNPSGHDSIRDHVLLEGGTATADDEALPNHIFSLHNLRHRVSGPPSAGSGVVGDDSLSDQNFSFYCNLHRSVSGPSSASSVQSRTSFRGRSVHRGASQGSRARRVSKGKSTAGQAPDSFTEASSLADEGLKSPKLQEILCTLAKKDLAPRVLSEHGMLSKEDKATKVLGSLQLAWARACILYPTLTSQ